MTTCASLAGRRRDLSMPVAAALLGYALFLFAPQVLNDGDTYLHIAVGEWILQHGRIPDADPFSQTLAGAPWVAHEWLAEVLTALAFRAGAWNGVVALHGAAAGLALGLFAYHLRRWLAPLPALVALALGAACLSPSLLARPHILALPILELWTAGLLLARSRGGAPSPWLVPLIPLWANLHGSFVFGLALVLPLAAEAMIEAKGGAGAMARRWSLFLAGALLAALATPHGWHGLLFPFELMQLTQLAGVGEWQPTSFQSLQPIEIALIALLWLGLTRRVRLPLIRLVMLIGLLHLALQHQRHQMLAGMVGALVLAEPIGRALAQAGPASPVRAARAKARALVPVLAGLAGLIILGAARAAIPIERSGDRMSPIAALAHVPAEVARRPVFNDYSFGAYLIFAGLRPFIDSRADMYGDAMLSTYGEVTRPDRAAFERVARRYRIGWTILGAGNPAVRMLDALPGWRRLYADDIAVVHVRDDKEP